MKKLLRAAAVAALGSLAFLSLPALHAQVPQLLNYQGRVAVGATNFHGAGSFKFALVNANASTTFWSNDGTSTAGSAPTAAVSLTVTRGLYSVLLGDTSLAGMTQPVPASVFANSDVRLRVWFNDGTTGFQLLTPDQRLAPVGYAMSAGSVPAGTITGAQIADGSITAAKIANGIVLPTQSVASGPVAAVANTTYTTSGASTTSFTLPLTAALGDVVEVTGGAGDWTVYGVGTYGDTWIPRETNRYWSSVASSSDGTKLVAANNSQFDGFLFTSTDGGATWTPRNTDASRNWRSVASSADGTKLVAVADYNAGGRIFTSTDSGVTWTVRMNDASRFWVAVASSADGSKLVAVDKFGIFPSSGGGQIYTSTDSGANWTPRETNRQWSAVASSADGSKLIAAVEGGQLFVSTNFGVSWTPVENNRNWAGVASSADGSKLVAMANGSQIYTSANGGTNWTPRATIFPWYSVASSADGIRLVAVANGSQIYLSKDAGVNWVARESNRAWQSVTSSEDGTRLVAVAQLDRIYTTSFESVSGGMENSGKFRYLGNGQWSSVKEVGLWYVHGANVYRPAGNVGIGLTDPGFSLDVVDRIRLRGPNQSAGAWLYDTTTSSNRAFIGLDSAGSVGLFGTGVGWGLRMNVTNGNVGIAGEITCVAVNLTSDRNAKEQFKPVNAREVLEKVARLPISEWQYKAQGDARHIGPMAQDFREAFALGRDEKHITSVDADGVALAAIQGLNQKVDERDAQIDRLRSENKALAARLAEIERRLGLPGQNPSSR